LVCPLLAALACAPALAQPARHRDAMGRNPRDANFGLWCANPAAHAREDAPLQMVTDRSSVLGEVEPNNLLTQAQIIPITFSSPDIDVLGYNAGIENDYYRVNLEKGDVLGVSIVATGSYPYDLDPQVTIFDPYNNIMVVNDDAFILYPLASPMPVIGAETDSAATIVAPYTGSYRILVQPFTGYQQWSEGPYTMLLRLRRSPLESQEGRKQILFLDFDGATVSPVGLFGFGNSVATLSPFSVFLPRWGLTIASQSACIDAVIEEVERNFEPLKAINPAFDIEIRNSRDHADPIGEPNVTRIILGGTVTQLGIDTIGIASSIDPGNFDTSETAVILLDFLSDPDPTQGISLNNTPRAPGFTIIDTIGRALGNIVAHEAGHTFGNWHTESANATRSIMDAGAATLLDFRMNVLETGIDQTLGTADDNPVLFTIDSYANEGVGAQPASREFTDIRTAYALTAGPAPCVGDIVDDGAINGADLAAVLSFWGTNDARGDLNGDGTVDGPDLAAILALWGPCP
jgi:hypothetical protein